MLAGVGFRDAHDKAKLEQVFSAQWHGAIKAVGLGPVHKDAWLKWRGDIPYFNWTQMTQLVSAGAMVPLRIGDGGYAMHMSYRPAAVLGLLRAQWRMTRFLLRGDNGRDAVEQSLALGIALQGLMLRLGKDSGKLALWLADPETVSPRHAATVQQIQAVQMRRTALSPAWHALFPHEGDDDQANSAPLFFWNDEIAQDAPSTVSASTGPWHGQPVCAGDVTGMAVVVARQSTQELAQLKALHNAPLILVMRHARPDAVSLYPLAGAVLFAHGGVLAHACCVAREMQLPCVTALGDDFYRALAEKTPAWLRVDAAKGDVELLEARPSFP